jgi:uncharacterized repeat protein (TIGR02543 family)
VSPQVALSDVTIWELRGGKSGENETPLGNFSDHEEQTFYLEPGNWNFTLTGYKNAVPILRGRLPEQTLSLVGPNNLSFVAAPIFDGKENGTFKITINLPSGHGITSVQVLKDGKIEQPTLTPSDDKVFFETTLAAQNYYFSFLLYKGDDLYGVVSEAVQVRANLQSEKTLVLTDLNRTFTISYHLDGGGGITSPGYYHTDAGLTLPSPTKEGYDFAGWYEDAGYSGPPVTAIPQGSTGDKDFYAKWEARHTINLHLSDAGDDAFDEGSFTVSKSDGTGGKTVRLDGSGYTSPRWFVDGELKATETSITVQAADYGVGAHTLSLLTNKDGLSWSKEISFTVDQGNLVTVIFRANDGTGAIYAVKTSEKESTVSDFPAAPTRTGYNFAGWNTQADGSGTTFGKTTVVSSDITVYAMWAHTQFNITLKQDAGNGAFIQTTSFTLVKSETGSQTVNLTDSAGYTSPRWFVDGELKTTETIVTVNAADYGVGAHTLSLLTNKGGISWSKEITFTVTN